MTPLVPESPVEERPQRANRLRSLSRRPVGSLLIHEIYRSLQGEGTHAGLPCVFVRLTACHLRCVYCDTPHAFHGGEPLMGDEILARVSKLARPGDLVEITGGEPLLQPEVLPLMTAIADTGRTVMLETSGACDISEVDPRVHVILDIKTPGSREAEANLWANLPLLENGDEVKFIVCDRDDFDWSLEQIRSHGLAGRIPILMGAAHGRVEPAELAAWILESGEPIRLQLQVHKLLWGANTRGV